MKILIYGHSGSGKTTLAKQLAEHYKIPNFNGDDVRKMFNDWHFEINGRKIQAMRMRTLSNMVEDCIVDLNPPDMEYLSIQNKTGIPDKTILIGDYKINQPKDGTIQREGVMQTPLLEENRDKQAF